MRKRVITVAAALAAIAAVASGLAWRDHHRVKTIAVITHASVTERSLVGLRQGLAARGWREGENLQILYTGIEPSPAMLRIQAHHYADQKVDLMVALSTLAAQAAREVAEPAGIPLLMAPASDPVGVGLVTSLAHPDQPITGVTFAQQEPRRLEWLTRLVPGVRTVWVPYNFADVSPASTVERLRPAAAKLGLQLITADVRSRAELGSALSTLPAQVEAIFIPPDAVLSSNMDMVVSAAALRRLPVTSPHRDGVALGALFSYGFDLEALGRQAARLADLILTGTPATDLPIEMAEMALSVNVDVAEKLQIDLPESALRHAVIFGRKGG